MLSRNVKGEASSNQGTTSPQDQTAAHTQAAPLSHPVPTTLTHNEVHSFLYP